MTALRAQCRAKRESISSGDRLRASEAVCAAIMREETYLCAKTVLLYSALGAELDVSPLLQHALQNGKRAALPRVISDTQMESISANGLLEKGAFGILEPIGEVIPPQELDLVIVPLLAFTPDCFRMGWGRGYYDRYLLRTGPHCAFFGAAYSQQLCKAFVPQPHDQQLHKIFTPDQIYES